MAVEPSEGRMNRRQTAYLIERVMRDMRGGITHVMWFPYGSPHRVALAPLAVVVKAIQAGDEVRVTAGSVAGQRVRLTANGALMDLLEGPEATPLLRDVPDI
jgi:hypothetical protein